MPSIEGVERRSRLRTPYEGSHFDGDRPEMGGVTIAYRLLDGRRDKSLLSELPNRVEKAVRRRGLLGVGTHDERLVDKAGDGVDDRDARQAVICANGFRVVEPEHAGKHRKPV